MQTFRLCHVTEYHYDAPVYLEPHRVLLNPRAEAGVRVLSHTLGFAPLPAGQTQYLDAEGNTVGSAWFSASTKSLTVQSVSVVEVSERNPFNFLIQPSACAYLPFNYPERERELLTPYLAGAQPAGPVHAFAQKVLQANGGQTVTFLTALCAKISRDFGYAARETGAAWSAEETLSAKAGACRDLAVLFLACAREMGLAGRYVSGYGLQGPEVSAKGLHAWAEIYVPGAGWLGFDPTQGIAVAGMHVAVAACADPANSAPIEGSFRGKATARLHYELSIETVTSDA